jgi:hypothetical protein
MLTIQLVSSIYVSVLFDFNLGNVTGSNAVNVFLGIGIAWTMAAVSMDVCLIYNF